MSSVGGSRVDRIRLLDEEPTLGCGLARKDLQEARQFAVADVIHLGRGSHGPHEIGTPDLLGLLVLDGLMIHRVVVAGRPGGELVSPGTLLRPWDQTEQLASLQFEVCWRVVEPVRLAVLDERITRVCTRWPPLFHELVSRAVERSHTLAFSIAIHCLEHVEVRLLVLLWHLADQFGRVTPAGTLVPLKLSHSNLAELIGSQRPSVSSTLTKLTRQGLISRRPDRTWLLHGPPPQQLQDRRIHPRPGTVTRVRVPA